MIQNHLYDFGKQLDKLCKIYDTLLHKICDMH